MLSPIFFSRVLKDVVNLTECCCWCWCPLAPLRVAAVAAAAVALFPAALLGRSGSVESATKYGELFWKRLKWQQRFRYDKNLES